MSQVTKLATRNEIMHCISGVRHTQFSRFNGGVVPIHSLPIKPTFGINDEDIIDIVESIEESFGVEISADEERAFNCNTTIQDLALLVESKLGA